MKMTKFFSVAALVGMLAMSASCSKDEAIETQDGEIITLSVPAMPGFDGDAQSRTVFTDNETEPTVKWEKNDIIYLGSIKDVEDGTTLQALITSNEFTAFTCTAVDETTGAATFQGTSIPTDADMAVYSRIPDKVTISVTVDAIALNCPATAVAPKSNDDLTHLAENDLLVAGFDTTSKTFTTSDVKGYQGKAFARVFGLYKFELTLPTNTSGTLGNLTLTEVSFTGVSKPYTKDDKTGLPAASGTGSGYKVDCSNLTLQDNVLTCYALAARKSNLKNKTLKLNLKVGEKNYSADIILNDKQNSIMHNSAIKFDKTLTATEAAQ